MSTTNTAFFSSVRTDDNLKKEAYEILAKLGLSWSAFVNWAARTLVSEKKVVFELRDENWFTPSKASELKKSMENIKAWKGLSWPMTASNAKKYLKDLK